MPWEDWTDLDAVAPHSSAWVRATAAGGDADYEGRVGWSGELGFGVQGRRSWAETAPERRRRPPTPTPDADGPAHGHGGH